MRLHRKSRRDRRMKWLREYRLESGCVDCGYKEHHAALQFDHVYGEKKNNVSWFAGRSMKQLQEEVDKCEVRCANCHAIRSFESGALTRAVQA